MLLVLPVITINEVAWMGTGTSANDEWIELCNNTDSPINLDGWILKTADGTPEVKLAGSILANGFYLLERTDDSTVPGIIADQIYTGALNNKGEKLELYDNFGNLIDSIDGSSVWPAGDNSTKQTMSRFGPNEWKSSKEPGGTPKVPNTFVTEAPHAEDNPPPTQSIPVPDRKDATTVSETPEAVPQENKELAAVGEPIRQVQGNPLNTVPFDKTQGKQGKQAPILLAFIIAIFSGIIILILKKRLK